MHDYSTGPLPLFAVEQPPYTIEAPGATAEPGETAPRRHPKARDGLLERPAPDVDTVYTLVERSAARHGSEPALGQRRFLGARQERKMVSKVVDGRMQQVEKAWTYFSLSTTYEYTTYAEHLLLLQKAGAGLCKLGLRAGVDRVHMFAATSPQWLTMAHGCASQSLTIVTAYDTLGAAGVAHTLQQTGAAAMFVDPHLLSTAATALAMGEGDEKKDGDREPSVRFIIYNDASHQPVPAEDLAAFAAAHTGLRLLSFAELLELGTDASSSAAGASVASVKPQPARPADLFCIMYTSGSTGVPKGVPVTHAGFMAAVAGLFAVVEPAVTPHDRVLAYLPLAHIFELVVETVVLFVGGTLGYGSPRTLTEQSMEHGCPGDLRAFAPTILVGVPQVWETVRKGVVAGVSAAGPVASALFWGYVQLKAGLARSGLLGRYLPEPVAVGVSALLDRLDGIVFARVRTLTGGRLRFIVNGASAIATDTKHFLSLVLAPMITGYGLTETCGNGALGSPLQWLPDDVTGAGSGGAAVSPAIEVKLVSQPELGYHTDPAQEDADPHGEIWMRGLPVATGYFDNAEESASAFLPGGWFRTGDIGAFDRRTGHLRVVDRLKNLVKMQGGEYIALEKLEAIYRRAVPVHNVLVYAEASHPRPIAVVLVNEKAIHDIAAEVGTTTSTSSPPSTTTSSTNATTDTTPPHLLPQVRQHVLRDLVAVGKQAGLTPIEIVQGVVLVDEEWTPINGLVTATQKLNRRQIQQRYAKEIQACFADK